MKLQSLKISKFEQLSPTAMKHILGGEVTSAATNGSYRDPNGGPSTPCKDRERVTITRDKNGEVISEVRDCTEYFINGAWV